MAYATQESAQTDRGLTRPMTRTPYPGREGCTCHSRVDPPLETYLMLDSLLVPTAIVALAEIGDKTQLLALILAARFRKPWPIIAGIVAATLANHAPPVPWGLVWEFLLGCGVALDPRGELLRHGAVDPGAGQTRR